MSQRHDEFASHNYDAEAMLAVAIDAAMRGGAVISAAANDTANLKVEQKSLNDFVTRVDRESEQAVTAVIREKFPNHTVVGEEFGLQHRADQSIRWYIDPLDGTTNFIRGIPHYAVSIGVTVAEQPVVAVVFDPSKQELFTAVTGQGSYLNQQPLARLANREINGALLATGVPFSGTYLEKLPQFSDTMNDLLMQNTCGIRRLGAAALDLAYVAAGRYDGYWEAGLRPWDICAGMLLVSEAGGEVSDLSGGTTMLVTGDILAAASTLHTQMCTITSKHYHAS